MASRFNRRTVCGPARLGVIFALLSFACGHKTAPPQGPGQPPGWDSEVTLPVAQDVNPSDSVVEINLEARLETLEVKPGVKTQLWTYNGSVPGPTIRAKKGDHLIVHFVNHLPEATSIHWHGVRVPNAMDGVGTIQDPIEPGGSFDYSFDLLDAGTFWYHPHIDSSAQVGFGLYGALIVEDPAESMWLGDELVLVLSDLSLQDDGSLAPGNQDGWYGDYFGREGAILLVNGKILPKIQGRIGAPQRWRVINASRARFQQFSVPGQDLLLVGSDGGLIQSPVAIDQLTLAPGERAEVYLVPKGPSGAPVTVQWTDSDRFETSFLRPAQDFFQFQVTDMPGATPPSLPSTLRTIDLIDTSKATTQHLDLTEMPGTNGQEVLGINGQTGATATTVQAYVGDTQIWEVRNTTNYDHPFHLHGFFFQVIDVNGTPWPIREWKDTFNIRGMQTARLALTFDGRAGMWMFHCHILDHADLGMMGMLMLMQR